MKNILLLITCFIFSLSIIAQGKSGEKKQVKDKAKNEKSVEHRNSEPKEKEKEKEKEAKEKKIEHSEKIWEGTYNKRGKGPKASKKQPSKVRAAFQRDYPNATNISWSKYRGDWTATFGNGLAMSTALYHANGERRDTRTSITKKEMPRNVLDSIFKRRKDTKLDDIIKVEQPNTVTDIFRIKDIIQGKPEYLYYNSNGTLVKYNY